MEEIEVKILEIDVDAVREQLDASDAEQQFDGTVKSLFFDFPDDAFSGAPDSAENPTAFPDGRIEAGGLLRLRQRGDYAFVTLKREIAKDAAKRMEEVEFAVDDFDTVRTFFRMLGLEELHASEKERAAWEDGDVLYVIDRYPGAPPLLEVEAPSMDALEAAVTGLGFTMDDTVSWDAADVMAHYGIDDW